MTHHLMANVSPHVNYRQTEYEEIFQSSSAYNICLQQVLGLRGTWFIGAKSMSRRCHWPGLYL